MTRFNLTNVLINVYLRQGTRDANSLTICHQRHLVNKNLAVEMRLSAVSVFKNKRTVQVTLTTPHVRKGDFLKSQQHLTLVTLINIVTYNDTSKLIKQSSKSKSKSHCGHLSNNSRLIMSPMTSNT